MFKQVYSRARGAATAVLLLGSLWACAADAPDSAGTSGTSPSLEPRTVVLDKAAQTILGQQLVYPSQSQAQVSSVIVRLQPGETTGFHRHDAPLFVYVMSGEVTVHYDGDVVKQYPAGSSFLEAQGTYHDGRNEGTEPVEIFTVSIGAEGVENTVKRP